jgi:hypothetical protein
LWLSPKKLVNCLCLILRYKCAKKTDNNSIALKNISWFLNRYREPLKHFIIYKHHIMHVFWQGLWFAGCVTAPCTARSAGRTWSLKWVLMARHGDSRRTVESLQPRAPSWKLSSMELWHCNPSACWPSEWTTWTLDPSSAYSGKQPPTHSE